eukprot:gene36438-44201_t
METVVHNIKQLKLPKKVDYNKDASASGMWWDCIVYIYAPRTYRELWDRSSDLEFLAQYCDLIENPDRRVTENLYLLQPSLIARTYSYVFILLDDIKIQAAAPINLGHMVELMRCNQLTVLSPIILGANKGGGQKFRNIMQIPAPASSSGYISSFVEIFAWVMTIPAYKALWELLCPSVNPYAWGYDF